MTIAKWIPLILLQIVIIVGILFALRHFLVRNVTQVTSHLDRMGEDFMKKQEEASKNLQQARQEAEQIVARARQEAEKVMEKSSKQSADAGEEVLKKACLQSEQIVDEANRTREFLMSEMDKKIREGAIEVAADLVLQVLSDDVRRDSHARRISSLLEGGLRGFDGMSIPAGAEVRVTSAYELSDRQKADLEEQLRSRLGAGIVIREETDPGLVAGAVVGVGDLIVDASLKYGIEEAARNVRRSAG